MAKSSNILVFRVDASTKIGTGHLFRCIRFAKLVQDQFRIFFSVNNPTPDLNKLVRAAGFELRSFESFKKIDLLVVDHYGIDEKWEKRARSKAKKVIVIDDLANRKHDCDVLIDANDNNASKYSKLLPENCIQLVGKKYFLNEAVPHSQKNKHKVKNISVFFGGTDFKNTVKAISILKEKKYTAYTFHFIVGAMNPERAKIEASIKPHKNFSFNCQPKNYTQIIVKSDLAIGSAGVASFERCFMAVPSMITKIAGNQEDNFRYLTKEKVSLGFTWSDFETVLSRALKNPATLDKIRSNCLKKFPDNRKKFRKTVLSTLISLSKAELKDSKFIHALRNSKGVRHNSLNKEVIPFSSHQKWFKRELLNTEHVFYVIEDLNGRSVGYVRYQIDGRNLRVSIAIDQNSRDMGYGSVALYLGEKKIIKYLADRKRKVGKFTAEILKGNQSSVGIFKKNGFVHVGKSIYVKDLS